MKPLARAAVLVALLSAVSAQAERAGAFRTITISRLSKPTPQEEASSTCPRGFLPDGEVCVAIPQEGDNDGQELTPIQNMHREYSGMLRTYEQIPRRPDRLADYEAYRYPVPPRAGGMLLSGYDLDRPDEQQRRGPHLSAVGHGGVDIGHARGTPVRSLPLEHQEGDAEVVFVGKLFGTSVATLHTVREGRRLRDYVVIHGHLDAAAPGVQTGMGVKEGDLLGFVGDTGSEGIVHLHLEVRQLRDGVERSVVRSQALALQTVSIACDPRNVLPLKSQ